MQAHSPSKQKPSQDENKSEVESAKALLINAETNSFQQRNLTWCEASFRNYNEEEETTKIDFIVYMRVNMIKRAVVVPLLALCTGLFFLLFLYWYMKLRRRFLYSDCTRAEATHLYIQGVRKKKSSLLTYL